MAGEAAAGGHEALAGKAERQGERELKKRIGQPERALGCKTYELEIAGEAFAGLGVRARAARSRELIAKGRHPAVVAHVLQVNQTGLYRTPKRPPKTTRRVVVDPVDRLIVDVALANPTDGTRMVAALVSRELGRQVNRKRAQRVMRQQRLCSGTGRSGSGAVPASSGSSRPDQLWYLDMTSIWVAEHGWTYLNAAIDFCTREIVGWSLALRSRTDEAIDLVDDAVAAHRIEW